MPDLVLTRDMQTPYATYGTITDAAGIVYAASTMEPPTPAVTP